jgi:hypothetical protein
MSPVIAKTASHEFLRLHMIEINETLPFIEAADELHSQDVRSVAIRSVVLCYVIGIGFGAEAKRLKASLEEFGLFNHASPKEQDLLGRETHTAQEKINATWLIECVQSFAWCLGLVDLDPFRPCDNDLASHFPKPFKDPASFISEATFRPFNEIYQQADLHYRLHWAARNARLTGRPSKITESLISERRRALDWAIGVEFDWDEVGLYT